jgi:hypothetical protein
MSPDKMSPDKMPLLKMPPDKLSPIPKCLLPKCHPTNCLLWQNVSPFKNVSWDEFQPPAFKISFKFIYWSQLIYFRPLFEVKIGRQNGFELNKNLN